MPNPRAFEYLLNAMERAAQSENPAEAGYAAARRAVFGYVANLEAEATRYRLLGAHVAHAVEKADSLRQDLDDIARQFPESKPVVPYLAASLSSTRGES